ncbi:hypothetical protein TNCV_315561 [Trichonephila clavipes]|nr:hypothetical protein TNCV_315561 [Trichonephila clavipes]
MRSLLKEGETYQAIEELAEIMYINQDSEIKYEKSDRHETNTKVLILKFQLLDQDASDRSTMSPVILTFNMDQEDAVAQWSRYRIMEGLSCVRAQHH